MSSRIPELRSTAAWRISLWTTLAFALGTALAFGVVYEVVRSIIQERSDAWLSGEAEVLADVSRNTARDALYDRIVEEVAELASREVHDEIDEVGRHTNTVFFLQISPGQQPLWVGPGDRSFFLHAINRTPLTTGIPAELQVEGWEHPFRVVYRPSAAGSGIYLGFLDEGSRHMLHRLMRSFITIWAGMVALGFLISFLGIYRTLQRVESITATVARIGSDDLSSRLAEGKTYDEISRLSRTFNRMLDRIQASVNQLRALTDSIAHDLKSPVTSIRGKLEMALSDGKGEQWREPVAEALDGLDRLSHMLNTTLDLAEAEAGALSLRKQPLDFGELIEHVVDLYQPAFFQKNQDLALDIQEGAVIEADANYLNRLLANLMENELTHLDEGRRIWIRLHARDENAELVVEDNGSGFPPDLRDRIFERFVKGEQSTGHGLGLAFVQSVAQAHGGKVTIGDRPGGGALIAITIPLAVVQAAA
jgi:signal transduction histidine kinase